MVYCKFLKKYDNNISYAIGARSNDLTGEIKIDLDGRGYEIIKQPRVEEVYPLFIDKMLIKYLNVFKEGIIPKKMSYEI